MKQIRMGMAVLAATVLSMGAATAQPPSSNSSGGGGEKPAPTVGAMRRVRVDDTAEAAAARRGTPFLVVKLLRDAGGLPTTGRDAKLHEQMAVSLRKYVAEKSAAAGRFTVATGAATNPKAPANSRPYTLEGDLSRTEDGAGGGAYLCVVRLVAEKGPGVARRRVVAQWAGMAVNLRYLFGNLERAPDVDIEGLAGELGQRIAAVMAAEQRKDGGGDGAPYAAFLQKATASRAVIATLLAAQPRDNSEEPDENAIPGVAGKNTLRSRQTFRLNVASKNAGSVFVVRDLDGERLVPLLVADRFENEPYVAPGKPARLPQAGDRPFVAPTLANNRPMDMTLYVLVRRDAPGMAARRPTAAGTGAPDPDDDEQAATATAAMTLVAQTTTTPFAATRFPAVATMGSTATAAGGGGAQDRGPASDAPVRVLNILNYDADDDNSAPPRPIAPDENKSIARLLRMFADDADGTWSAQRLTIRVVPRVQTRGGSGGGTATPPAPAEKRPPTGLIPPPSLNLPKPSVAL